MLLSISQAIKVYRGISMRDSEISFTFVNSFIFFFNYNNFSKKFICSKIKKQEHQTSFDN